MKVRRILVLIAAAALAPVVYAKAEAEHSAPRPRSLPPVRVQGPNYAQLGAEQAVLDFCSRIDSGDEKQIDAEAKLLFAGIREDGLEKARRSTQYKNAYTTITSVVGEIPLPEAVQGCKDIIASAAPAKASGKNPVSGNTGGNTPGHTAGHTPGKSVGNRAKDNVRK
jgi:hypothetical protein